MLVKCFYCGEYFDQHETNCEITRADKTKPYRLIPIFVCKRCYLIRDAVKKAKDLKIREENEGTP